ncbi:MAG: hypothetical protein H6821_12125 [Planctomycetaceae bacterium]|nr:hypothetical protein [Planctomycetaceae bacterium]
MDISITHLLPNSGRSAPEQIHKIAVVSTVVAPHFDELGLASGGVRYGLEDESSRLNLNMLLDCRRGGA